MLFSLLVCFDNGFSNEATVLEKVHFPMLLCSNNGLRNGAKISEKSLLALKGELINNVSLTCVYYYNVPYNSGIHMNNKTPMLPEVHMLVRIDIINNF